MAILVIRIVGASGCTFAIKIGGAMECGKDVGHNRGEEKYGCVIWSLEVIELNSIDLAMVWCWTMVIVLVDEDL